MKVGVFTRPGEESEEPSIGSGVFAGIDDLGDEGWGDCDC